VVAVNSYGDDVNIPLNFHGSKISGSFSSPVACGQLYRFWGDFI